MRRMIRALMKFVSGLALLLLLVLGTGSANAASTARRQKPAPTAKPERPKKTNPAPELGSAVRRQLDSIYVGKSWKHIVIHHTATPSATAKGIDRFHREKRRMENGMAYHFLIGNGKGMGDGEVYVGERWRRQIQGGHLASEALNQSSIGICLVGNFEKQPPTSRQMESLRALIGKLRQTTRLPASAVTTHRGIHPRHTSCPGRHFHLERQ